MLGIMFIPFIIASVVILFIYLSKDTKRRGYEGAFVKTVNDALEEHYGITYYDFKITMDFIGEDKKLKNLFLNFLPDDLNYFINKYYD